MRQALHIFRKDLRRGWPLLLLWAAILVFWIEPVWRDPLYAEELESIDALRAGIVVLAGMIGAALVIQHDALVGVREFWMTRPIGRGSLLAAKTAFVGLFLLTPPLALELALLTRYGLPPERWAVQATQLALPWASAIAIACLIASWTRGLPAFLAVSTALLLGPNLGVGAANLLRGARISLGLSPGVLPALGVLAIALLALQYATRRRLIGALAGAALTSGLWFGPVRFDPYSYLHRVTTPTLPAVRVALTPGPGRDAFAAERPGATAGRAMDLWFVPSPTDDREDQTIEVGRVEGEIEWDDGRATPFYAMGEWYLTHQPLQVSPTDWSAGLVSPQSAWRALGVQGDETFESLLGQSGTLRGKSTGAVWRRAIVERLPLEAGAAAGHKSSRIRVIDVDRAPGELSVRLRSRELINLWRAYPRMQVALANAQRGETLPLSLQGGGGMTNWGGLLMSPPFLLIVKEGVWSPSTADLDADWLAGAELLLSFYDFAGTADVLVEAPSLTVEAFESQSPSLVSSWRPPWF
jgi:hypothetical protein